MSENVPPRPVFIYNQTKETFLAFRVKVADSIFSRLLGLLGKRFLEPDSGVWIIPANSVHTIGMLFAFDLVLIDKDFTVVGLCEMVRPFRFTRPNFRAESVIELPAHTIFRSRTEIGDRLVIERYEAKSDQPDSEKVKEHLALHASGAPPSEGVWPRQPAPRSTQVT
jgi:uncharacterized membrane protein (UPF0127 family)